MANAPAKSLSARAHSGSSHCHHYEVPDWPRDSPACTPNSPAASLSVRARAADTGATSFSQSSSSRSVSSSARLRGAVVCKIQRAASARDAARCRGACPLPRPQGSSGAYTPSSRIQVPHPHEPGPTREHAGSLHSNGQVCWYRLQQLNKS